MAKNIGELINLLATSAGVEPTNEQLLSVLTKSELANAPIPDSLFESIVGHQSKLYTEDSAKNNETIKNHFYALFANGNEAKMKALAEENGILDIFEEIKKEKGQGTKIEKLVNAIKEAESKKAKSTGGDKKEYEEQITALNAQLKTLKESIPSAIAERDSYWLNTVKSTEQNRLLSTYAYGDHLKDLPSDVLLTTANSLVDRKLQEKKLKAVYDPKTGFSLKTESDMEYFENNSPVAYKAFVDSVLAENKMLKIAGATPTATPKSVHLPAEHQNNGGRQINTSKFDAVMQEQIERANAQAQS